jgi:hypothetical protein
VVWEGKRKKNMTETFTNPDGSMYEWGVRFELSLAKIEMPGQCIIADDPEFESWVEGHDRRSSNE